MWFFMMTDSDARLCADRLELACIQLSSMVSWGRREVPQGQGRSGKGPVSLGYLAFNKFHNVYSLS